MYSTQLKLEEKKKKRTGPKAAGQHQKLSAHRPSGLRASRRPLVRFNVSPPIVTSPLPAPGSHKEQPAMYFPVANLFLTSDMR